MRRSRARKLAWAFVLAATGTQAQGADEAPSMPQIPEAVSPDPPVSPQTADMPTPQQLEEAGAIIGTIVINNQNIFDLNDPREDRSLYRLANRIHITTREGVIRQQLLFAPGERYSHRKLEESERILRSARYLYDAWIRPVAWHDGVVDLEVTTKDVWTLNPGVSFGRKGGKSTTGFQLEELNILGTGVSLALSHNSEVDRDRTTMQIKDPHLFDGRTLLDMSYADTSDGHARRFELDRPFYALDTRWALGGVASDEELIQPVYDEGHTRAKYFREWRYANVYGGLSAGLVGDWVQRWTFGAIVDDRRYDTAPDWTGPSLVPEDRKFVYPWIGYEVLQDEFQKFKNHDQIGRTEDFYLGTRFYARVGWADSAFGSSRDALMLTAQVAHAEEMSARSTLLFSSTLRGRLSGGDWENTVIDGAVRYYVQQSKKALLYATLNGAVGERIDLDEQLVLGGDNGLRGYPLRYQSGNARAMFTIEQRYFTNWYPWRLFRIGGAAFFDVGRTWGRSPLGTPSQGLLKDIGVGLRIGSSRSGLGNVIHVDLAFPLDGDSSIDNVQLLVETLEKF